MWAHMTDLVLLHIAEMATALSLYISNLVIDIIGHYVYMAATRYMVCGARSAPALAPAAIATATVPTHVQHCVMELRREVAPP